MNRRDFLRLLSLGATATAAGVLLPEVEPIRRWWAVPRNAPVGGGLRLPDDFSTVKRLHVTASDGTEFECDNPGFVSVTPWRGVVTYEAAEQIETGGLVALRPDGKAVNAKGDPNQVVVGHAVRSRMDLEGWYADVAQPIEWLAPIPGAREWLGPKRV